MARVTKKTLESQEMSTGEYAIQAIDVDKLRVDLYDQCIPAATGEPTAGWGCVFLTHDQAIGMARVLTNGALLVKPRGAPAKKRGKKK